jgi:hypothetical protein
VFRPQAPDQIILSELLTTTDVLAAFASSTHGANSALEPK